MTRTAAARPPGDPQERGLRRRAAAARANPALLEQHEATAEFEGIYPMQEFEAPIRGLEDFGHVGLIAGGGALAWYGWSRRDPLGLGLLVLGALVSGSALAHRLARDGGTPRSARNAAQRHDVMREERR